MKNRGCYVVKMFSSQEERDSDRPSWCRSFDTEEKARECAFLQLPPAPAQTVVYEAVTGDLVTEFCGFTSNL